MSLIHQKLYQAENLNLINLQEYLTDLAKQILHSSDKQDLQIGFTISAQGMDHNVDKAVPLGMIVNELITNSIKHGFQGRKMGNISITVQKSNQFLKLIYQDDGRGLTSESDL